VEGKRRGLMEGRKRALVEEGVLRGIMGEKSKVY
jgi:hypothetical protein